MKGASAFLCLALALLPRCSAQKDCPEGWTSKTFSDGTGKCYLVSEDVVSFSEVSTGQINLNIYFRMETVN
jgi:hypothetical protein